jgi:large subunit ribosomal protein L13
MPSDPVGLAGRMKPGACKRWRRPVQFRPFTFHPSQRVAEFRTGQGPERNEPDQTKRASFMSTFTAKNETVQRDWYIVDASGKTLGRLSTELARRLRGKHKPVYTPHVDTGDYLIVINAEKITVTGKKLTDKKYHRFTGYIGNLKTESLQQALDRHPERVIETAVKGMLPKGPLGRAMYRKLKVYAGTNHPHAAQQPQVLDI